MCDLKYMDKKNTHNLLKITNIYLLFRSFINALSFSEALYIYIYIYITHISTFYAFIVKYKKDIFSLFKNLLKRNSKTLWKIVTCQNQNPKLKHVLFKNSHISLY